LYCTHSISDTYYIETAVIITCNYALNELCKDCYMYVI